MIWKNVKNELPDNGRRILAFVPGNKVFLPGKTGEYEIREVIVLRFCRDFYPEGTEKCLKHGPHFWQGEGNSNHFFADVTHWMEIPSGPTAEHF